MLMESACAAVFHLMALNFPRQNEMWNQIAMDEEAHAEIIAKGMNISDPESFTGLDVAPGLECIRQTIEYASGFKKMLAKDKVTLKQSFDMVIRLLKMKDDSYKSDLLGKETEERIRRVFQRLFDIDRSSLNLVKTVMTEYNFTEGAEA